MLTNIVISIFYLCSNAINTTHVLAFLKKNIYISKSTKKKKKLENWNVLLRLIPECMASNQVVAHSQRKFHLVKKCQRKKSSTK